jgi:tetratricopeptide (TPR) repeat protein
MQQETTETAIVGRDAEIRAISDAVKALGQNRGRVLYFSGEPGIGKSTLARLAADRAHDSGISVYWGFAWEAGGAPAYWPWTQLLRSLVADRNVPTESLSSLGQILPEAYSAADKQEDLNPEQARFRLLEAVRGMLDSSARQTPLLLILEDLHAADSDSLNLLHHVVRHAASMPVLIVGTYREAEAKASKTTEPLWRSARDATVFHLSRLDENEVREYLLGAGHEPDEHKVQAVVGATSGNPLFVTELMTMLEHQEADVGDRLPDTVEQVIRQQIGLLPAETIRVLGHATIFGREFEITELTRLIDSDVNEIQEAVRPAVDIGFADAIDDRRVRFSHALHREVLYGDLSASDRSLLHTRYADELRRRIADGDEDRWSELATHLSAAGDEHRLEAIDAWRNAARRAKARLAFVDAAESLQNAVQAFGEGPRYDPAERVGLLLECAESMLLTGDIDGGRGICGDAFAIARTLEDAELMSECALTYGSAIVVASIDRNLVGMLKDSLGALPEDNAAMRARVQARLAAALQPAENPAEPMAMAREAISLARATNDECVLHETLRAAISAIMDFASATERMPLNREFAELSARLGDVPGQFRGNLRLIIDAAELGDRQLLDDAVDTCEQIAARIALPHYQWRAASARAMLATIEGRFAAASRLLDEAEELARIVDDLESTVTIPLQRFALLCDWDSDEVTPLDVIESQLTNAFAGPMAEAEFFIRPFIAAYSVADRKAAKRLLSNERMVVRSFAGGDRFSLIAIGQLAILAEDTELARRAYDRLLQSRTECATPGLMGSTWSGPVALMLGRLALFFGEPEEARSFLEDALQICREMRAGPFMARALARLADAEELLDEHDAVLMHRQTAQDIVDELSSRLRPIAPRPAIAEARPAAGVSVSIRRQGDTCEVCFGEGTTILKASKGLDMLARLLAEPDKDVHVLDLSGATEPVDAGDAGPALDEQARADYKSRVTELQESLDEATELGDQGRIDALREELDFITRELSRAFGLGGRKRRSGSAAERARVNVRRRIKDAIQRIEEQIPDAGRYLENTVKTGTYCRYSPM